MRRDTQIGIILGIVILVIIGVFLSTRTSDNETILPDLVLSEGGRQGSDTEEIDINGFFNESRKAEPEESSSVEYPTGETEVSEEPVKLTQPENKSEITVVETPKDDTSLEGRWEGVAEEIVEESEITEQSKTIDDTEVAQKIPSARKIVIAVEESQTPSYDASTNAVYYKVQSNDTLFKIARIHYGDGEKWVKIFEANSDSMSNPNALYIGQKLLIPGITVEKGTNKVVLTPVRRNKEVSYNADTHTVRAGDTLYRIAEKYYDDPSVWIKIYEANEDTIEDKGLLKEGQILIIPKL